MSNLYYLPICNFLITSSCMSKLYRDRLRNKKRKKKAVVLVIYSLIINLLLFTYNVLVCNGIRM